MTHRDREILRWIGRLRIVSAAHVAARFGLGRAVAYSRLGGLVSLGLLDHQRIFHAVPGVYLATKAGLATVHLGMPPARVDLRTYHHDLELSCLVLELEREFGAASVVTEREMRVRDAPVSDAPAEYPAFAVPLGRGRGQLQLTPAGHPRLHFPDAAVRLHGRDSVLAVELERTAKGRARLRRILHGFVSARHIERVRYVVTDNRVQELVRSEVGRLRAEALVEIVPVHHENATADAA